MEEKNKFVQTTFALMPLSYWRIPELAHRKLEGRFRSRYKEELASGILIFEVPRLSPH